MQCGIRVGGTCRQILTDNETRFSVWVFPDFRKRNVRRQGNITRYLRPSEVEGVRRQPHILAATGDTIYIVFRIEVDPPRKRYIPDVLIVVEEARNHTEFTFFAMNRFRQDPSRLASLKYNSCGMSSNNQRFHR